MDKIDAPIIEKVTYDGEVAGHLNDVIGGDSKKRQLLFDYPTVYLIYAANKNHSYEVYVGETNDIERRTQQHLNDDPRVRDDWKKMSQESDAHLLIIGHDHFNKSLTLDIENQMMLFMLGVPSVKRLNNRRENEQNDYYTSDEKEIIFSKIWRRLRALDNHLFPIEREIRDSAIFKASPFHKLTPEQERAKDVIIDKVIDSLMKDKTGQLILVEGEAGSGKTVLLSTIFYLLSHLDKSSVRLDTSNLKNYLLINHDEQFKVYRDIIHKLELDKRVRDTVSKPTHFINSHPEDAPKVDIVLIDEAHLLWTQGKQAYRGKNQLDDILNRSRVTIAVFDKKQILKTEEYLDSDQIRRMEERARKQNDLIMLTNQLRINAEPQTVHWIKNLIDKRVVTNIPSDKKYDLRVFDNALEMYNQIKVKAKNEESGLSRILATFDWKYNSKRKPKNGGNWMVTAGNLSLPWNLQLEAPKEVRKSKKKLPWAEQEQTIGEVGSTYTIQGFDLNYCGVIIGPSVKYRNGHIIFDSKMSENTNAVRNRTLRDGQKAQVADQLLPNELNVLLTRGVNGLYIYAVDEQLRKALLKAQQGLIGDNTTN
ncbi:DUF2075 domain-containing protein [Lentilactobacillus farraginis]|uniref:GIY-YIG domain-containing protein n=1 Tax=Lentilactobacillus farraginis DSM 18382 = JCM 14108 TaxID=1423743 RepID=X0PBX5_9LACO|nr:DUF2075 domain-containing protein [Lentilactobacillus farraginis]KRM05843.1 hypothetical protein FD41_GL000688 [Lentilactobacillus farraginis DSM 18382 = JCM 14108]GAF37578.1 hypothetical protein JCM14108_2631 [Lentilactobacillus farraginis DSM 18382 = JCM 14108]